MNIRVSIPEKIILGIFDKCDECYDNCETGGRLLGFYKSLSGVHNKIRHLKIVVKAVIPAGPNAKATSTSLFQDGAWQEKMFRAVEKQHPSIEHLGNWHTHHVNGLDGLSIGDVTTYLKSVNSDKHNTDFFYALLVTKKLAHVGMRYAIRHYIFFRDDESCYEIHPARVEIKEGGVLQLA